MSFLCAPPPPAKNIRPGHIPTFIFTHFPTHTYHTGTVNAMLTPPPSCSTRPCPLPALGTIVASVVGSFATRYLPFAQSNQMHPLSLLVWPVGAGTARRGGGIVVLPERHIVQLLVRTCAAGGAGCLAWLVGIILEARNATCLSRLSRWWDADRSSPPPVAMSPSVYAGQDVADAVVQQVYPGE